MDELALDGLVDRTKVLAREWGDLHDKSGSREAGAAAVVLLSLVGALLSGEHAEECLDSLQRAIGPVNEENGDRILRQPN